MAELISVIIPVYNVKEYLERCVKSVINQSYKEMEIVLVNDGSTDGSAEICDSLKGVDSRIIVIHKKNGGLSDARNKGIDIAKGKYITFIDSDDYVTDDYIEYLYKMISENQAQISICGLLKTSNENETRRIQNPIIEKLGKEQALKEMLYAKKYSVSAPAKMYLTELFDNVRFPLGKFSEDMFTTYKVFDKSTKVVYGNQLCYYYFCRKGSLITSSFTTKKLDVLEGVEQLGKDIPIEKYGLSAAYSSQILECVMAILQSRPTSEEIEKYDLWSKIKENRRITMWNKEAAKRIRGYAILSYLGKSLTIKILCFYYRMKWK